MLPSKLLIVGLGMIGLGACESSTLQGGAMGAAGSTGEAKAIGPDSSESAGAHETSTGGATSGDNADTSGPVPADLNSPGSAGASAEAGAGVQNPDTAGAGGPGPASGSSSVQVQLSDVVVYENLAQQVQLQADSYHTAMMAAGMTLARCATEHEQYDAAVRPLISQMLQMSGEMDGFMNAHDGAAYADFSCTARGMMDELDSHRLVACTASDLGAAQAEAARDADAIASYAQHIYERCGQMTNGMHGHDFVWSAMAGTCAISDKAAGDGDPAALGARIFDSGIGANGQPVPRTTSLGGGMMGGGSGTGMATACANCHGRDGRGLRTMMFAAPDITYTNLTDPSGMREVDGTHGHTYTDALIRRAVTQGIGADGDELDSIMPRWQLDDADWNNLLAYLKTLP